MSVAVHIEFQVVRGALLCACSQQMQNSQPSPRPMERRRRRRRASPRVSPAWAPSPRRTPPHESACGRQLARRRALQAGLMRRLWRTTGALRWSFRARSTTAAQRSFTATSHTELRHHCRGLLCTPESASTPVRAVVDQSVADASLHYCLKHTLCTTVSSEPIRQRISMKSAGCACG